MTELLQLFHLQLFVIFLIVSQHLSQVKEIPLFHRRDFWAHVCMC